jgi:hypothetical protein
VAQVRVIFNLPEEYGSYKHPLAYVDWYKPFRAPVPDLNMHQVSLSSHNHRQRASVIPVTDIVRTCHLQPHCGRAINRTWDTSNVLNLSPTLYVNPYLRHHDFYLFRYLVALHARNQP